MKILAIDPGNTESAFVIIDADTRRPTEFGKWENWKLRSLLRARARSINNHVDLYAIEMVASLGADVFETCVWIGRFTEVCGDEPQLVKRHPIKMHHCHSAKANDANIRQALVDRFAHGQPNHGKGTKARPGFFYGFSADMWQAFALAVYVADTLTSSTRRTA